MEKKSKLRTYRTFKAKLCLEKYLLTSGSFAGRRLMTTLRSGTNDLMIEKGRWCKMNENDRTCQQCDMKVVESEEHMVAECPRYASERLDLFAQIYHHSNNKFNLLTIDKHQIFLLLINGTGDELEMQIYKLFQSFLVKAFIEKERLLVINQRGIG